MSCSIQSSNYVPGVSGWKLDQATGTFEINGLPRERSNTVIKDGKLVISTNGSPRVVLDNLPDLSDVQELKPFIVVDGVTYIRQSFIDDATVTKALITQECSARAAADAAISSRVSSIETSLGKLQPQFVVSADRFSFNDRCASEILRDIRTIIGETSLGQELKRKVALMEGSVSEAVKEVIRAELQPGGLLHRSR